MLMGEASMMDIACSRLAMCLEHIAADRARSFLEVWSRQALRSALVGRDAEMRGWMFQTGLRKPTEPAARGTRS